MLYNTVTEVPKLFICSCFSFSALFIRAEIIPLRPYFRATTAPLLASCNVYVYFSSRAFAFVPVPHFMGGQTGSVLFSFFLFSETQCTGTQNRAFQSEAKKKNTQSSNIERTCAHAHRHQTSSSPTRQKRNAAKRKVKSKARSEQSSEPIRRLSSPECGSATRFPFCAASLCR